MDPMILILTALATGAAEGIASETIKNAYQSLKSLIQGKLAHQPESVMMLNKFGEKPQVWEAQLKNVLKEVGADADLNVIKMAQLLMGLTNPEQAAAGKYNVQINGKVQGLVQGDNSNVTMTFGSEAPEE